VGAVAFGVIFENFKRVVGLNFFSIGASGCSDVFVEMVVRLLVGMLVGLMVGLMVGLLVEFTVTCIFSGEVFIFVCESLSVFVSQVL